MHQRVQISSMARYEVDRRCLPGPWDDPLIFQLKRGAHVVVAEVQRGAALECSWAPSSPGLAWFTAPDRIEVFLLDLEDAVERLLEKNFQDRLNLKWADLYPSGP